MGFWKRLPMITIVSAIAILGVLTACSAGASPSPAKATPTVPTGGQVASANTEALPSLTVQAELAPPPNVPTPVTRKEPALVKVALETRELKGTLDNGVEYTFWTFNGTVPGPMVRVREGDTVELTLKNSDSSTLPHSIDLHAVTGPGGGATLTQLVPGKEATFRFKALNPGLYVYHCATPIVPHHVAMGMYGLILVEPQGGLPDVDREFYVMQGDFYTQEMAGQAGVRQFDMVKMLAESPDYVVFNGRVGALTGGNALKAKVGEKVRIYFGVGGPNLTSSFHVIGEIFDAVYPEASSEALHNIQTTLVPSGGATMVEFGLQTPGTFLLVDHSLGRVMKGAAGQLVVEGTEVPEIYSQVK